MLRLVFLTLLSLSVQAETLSLCVYHNWSPWIYLEGDNYDGVLIEQLALFKQKRPKLDVEIVDIRNWKRCQLEVASGNISMILGANKTPDRQKEFDYLSRPSIVNHTGIGIYALKGKAPPVSSLDKLDGYSLSFARGDSFGKVMDEFIKRVPKEKLFITNNIFQSIKMVELERVDYFLLVESSYQSTMRDYYKKFQTLKNSDLEKIYTHSRATPVYIVFGKGSGNYEKYGEVWLDVIEEYHSNFNIDERIRFHSEQSGN